jgi:prepilin-type N-terminal cleavage/methylation domain-containing protein
MKGSCSMHLTLKKNYRSEAGFSAIELLIVMTIMVIILGVLGTIVGSMESSYSAQRPRTEAINSANVAMDSMVRLIRMSGNNLSNSGITPGATGADGFYHTIRLKSDWNPVDGVTTGTFEDVTFSVSNNALMIQEGAAAATNYVDSIGSVTFTYYDNTNTLIADPVAHNDQISLVKITLTTSDANPMTFTTIAHLRKN